MFQHIEQGWVVIRSRNDRHATWNQAESSQANTQLTAREFHLRNSNLSHREVAD